MKNNSKVAALMSAVVNEFTTIAQLRSLAECKFGYAFVAKSTPRFAAPKTTAAMWAQQFGCEMPEVVKVTLVTNARSGGYESKVNKVATTEFTSDPLKGYQWVIPNVLKRAEKDGGLQLTISYTDNDKTGFVSEYVVGGNRFATADEVAFIKSRLYSSPKSQKQMAHGVSAADIVNVRNYKLSNILAIGKTPDVKKVWESLTE